MVHMMVPQKTTFGMLCLGTTENNYVGVNMARSSVMHSDDQYRPCDI